MAFPTASRNLEVVVPVVDNNAPGSFVNTGEPNMGPESSILRDPSSTYRTIGEQKKGERKRGTDENKTESIKITIMPPRGQTFL